MNNNRSSDGVSLTLLEKRAEAGNARARMALASLYRKGSLVVVPNLARSASYLLQAAMAGHYPAMWMVASNYQDGSNGFPVDKSRAMLWCHRIERRLEKDAAGGKEYAQKELAAIEAYRRS